MPLNPTHSSFIDSAQELASSAWSGFKGIFSHAQFSPEVSLEQSPNIDPLFIPRVPMSNANLDVHLLGELGKMGMKRGKEITAQTHPEFHNEWVRMCQRAGLNRVPQLILAESKALNAASLTNENAVVITTGLFKRLNFREVRAVLGHELGHETSNHTTPRVISMIGLGGVGLLLGNSFAKRGGIGALIKEVENPSLVRRFAHKVFGNGKESSSVLASEVYMTAGAAIGGVTANQLTVRPTELDADRKGTLISGDPEGLIAALTKLQNHHDKKPILSWIRQIQSGYPSMETRIARLREMARNMPSQNPMPPRSTLADASEVSSPMATQTTPNPQIHAISQAERVSSPTQAPIAAL